MIILPALNNLGGNNSWTKVGHKGPSHRITSDCATGRKGVVDSQEQCRGLPNPEDTKEDVLLWSRGLMIKSAAPNCVVYMLSVMHSIYVCLYVYISCHCI